MCVSSNFFSHVHSETLVEQVHDYQKIRAGIHADLQGRIQQTILSVIERSDKDMDYVLESDEMEDMLSRLRMLPGVTFDETTLRKSLGAVNGDLNLFFDRHLSVDTTPNNQIFQLV